MSRRSEREQERALRRQRGRRRNIIIVSAVTTVALVGVAGVAWAGGQFDPWFDQTPPCDQPVRLSVVADPTIASTVQAVAADYDAREGSCSRTEVVAQQSADTAAMLASGIASDVDAWIPDSPVWLVRMSSMARSLGRPVPDVALERSIASSPVVFAAPASRAAEYTDLQMSWRGLLNGDFPAILPAPEASSASLNALQSLEGNVDISVPRQFQSTMIRLSDSTVASAEDAFAALESSESGTVAIASEQQIARHNGAGDGPAVVALYPNEGTQALSYPFLRMLEPAELAKNLVPDDEDAGDDPGRAARELRAGQLDALKIALWEATDRFAADGFRDGTGGGELALDGVIPTASEVSPAAAGAQVAILRSWGVLSLRSRILTVIDLSGSMEEPTVTGLRRIDLLQQAATSTISQFSGAVDLGMWAFSTLRVGEQDWEDLVPVGSLANESHKQRITDVIASLPDRLGGATGLYDTTLAAVRSARAGYDPEKVNSVLLLTDGRNEDDNGISLEQLLGELESMNDPARPVPVVMVGIGPDTDMQSMRAIAEATGGAAYSAERPEDLNVVLTDALSQRACRPNC